MLLKPKRTKFQKSHKGRIRYVYRPYKLTEKENKYGIVALEPGRITASNIYATDLGIKRKLKKSGGGAKEVKNSILLKIFPHIPVTAKPIEVRMGKGKGRVDHWMTRVKVGTILWEIDNSNEVLVKAIWKLANSKLPIQTKLVLLSTSGAGATVKLTK